MLTPCLNLSLRPVLRIKYGVQMAHFGYPVTGDKKYTARKNPLARVALHANLMELKHPISGEHLKFELVPPSNFRNLVAKG